MYSHDAEEIAGYEKTLREQLAGNTENAEMYRGIIKALETFKGTTINKRLITHILKHSPKLAVNRSIWNSETRKDEDQTVEVNVWSLSLENKNYGKQSFVLVASTYGNYARRRNIWFENVEDLSQMLASQIESLDINNADILKLIDTLEPTIKAIDEACNKLNDLMDIRGLFYISDNFPRLRR